MPLPVQTSERSFYNAEIIKESKARMGFFHKSRNRQTNIQQPCRRRKYIGDTMERVKQKKAEKSA